MKKFFAFVLTLAMVCCSSSLVASAAEIEPAITSESEALGIGGAEPFSTTTYFIGKTWTTIAFNANGIGSEVYIDITNFNGISYQVNLVFIDVNNNVVWTSDNSTGVFNTGHWWAGTNVKSVQMQIVPRAWGIPDTAEFRVRVTY